MTQLFKKKPESELRSVRYPILLNEKEAEKIRKSAKDRQLSMAEFMRRAALGRKAPVNYDVELVLTLRELVRAINSIGELHNAMIERGITPPVDDWRQVKMDIRLAVERIAQKNPYDFS